MRRYQFEPREGHCLNFEDARAAAVKFGAIRLRVAHPMMLGPHHTRDGRPVVWRGSNQPKTLCFTLPEDRAMDVQEEYGWHRAFVRERHSK